MKGAILPQCYLIIAFPRMGFARFVGIEGVVNLSDMTFNLPLRLEQKIPVHFNYINTVAQLHACAGGEAPTRRVSGFTCRLRHILGEKNETRKLNLSARMGLNRFMKRINPRSTPLTSWHGAKSLK